MTTEQAEAQEQPAQETTAPVEEAPAAPEPDPFNEEQRFIGAVEAMEAARQKEAAEEPSEDAPAEEPPAEEPAEEEAAPADEEAAAEEAPQDVDAILESVARERHGLMTKTKAAEKALADAEARASEAAKILEAAKADPIAFMNEHGDKDWYMRATNHFLGKGDPKPSAPKTSSEVEELRAKIEEMEQRQVEQQREAGIKVYLGELNAKLAQPEYAPILQDEFAREVLDKVVVGYAQANPGKLLPVDEALGKVKQAQLTRLKKLAQSEWWHKDVMGQQADEPPPQQAKHKPSAGTISNQTPARVAPPTSVDEDDVFDEESRIQRAIRAMETARTE